MVVHSRVIDEHLVEHEVVSFESILPYITGNNVGELKRVSRSLESNFLDSILDEAGHSLLHIATVCGHTDCVYLLIRKGMNLNHADSINGDTPLHRAIQRGHVEIAELLLKNGANVNVFDKMGNSPLHEAMEQGNLKCVKLLLSYGVDVNARNEDGLTALHTGVEYDNRRCYATVLCQGGDDSIRGGDEDEDEEERGTSARTLAIEAWGEEWYQEIEIVLRMQRELADCGPLLGCLLSDRTRTESDSMLVEFLSEVDVHDHVLSQSVLPYLYGFHSCYV